MIGLGIECDIGMLGFRDALAIEVFAPFKIDRKIPTIVQDSDISLL